MAQQQAASAASAAAASCPSAQVVGNAFVHQYYHILHQSPELVYRFYQEISKLGRPEADNRMGTITTMQAINEKILSLDYGECRAEIKTVDAQESFNRGVLVLVTGYLTGKDNVKRNFTQSFFLAPQDKGFYVLNDIFRYMEDVSQCEGNQGLANGAPASLLSDHETAPSLEEVPAQPAALSEEEFNTEEVYNPSENDNGSVVEEEVPVAEVVDEVPSIDQVDTQAVADSSSNSLEDAPKKSYASIVKVMKESPAPLTVSAPAPTRSAPANSERNVAPYPVKVMKESPAPLTVSAPAPTRSAPANSERNVAPYPVTASLPETPAANSNSNESGAIQEEADGYSIYIKNLPMNATPAQLEEEFKKFGPIKIGGVQVRSNKQQGFCFGFVEFEVATAVQSAIEASPVTVGGRQAFVEEKRASGSRVNNRGRYPAARGGGSSFRNEGMRGRGNYGSSRNYGRGDFSNRTDFVNRSTGRGTSIRGGDGGYQRIDQFGNNGGRVNRSSGLGGVAKTVVPRVSASA